MAQALRPGRAAYHRSGQVHVLPGVNVEAPHARGSRDSARWLTSRAIGHVTAVGLRLCGEQGPRATGTWQHQTPLPKDSEVTCDYSSLIYSSLDMWQHWTSPIGGPGGTCRVLGLTRGGPAPDYNL